MALMKNSKDSDKVTARIQVHLKKIQDKNQKTFITQ